MNKVLSIVLLFLLSSFYCSAQSLTPAPAGKAVVYFVRPSLIGFAINFSYFDSTALIGRFNAPKYIRYECEPGSHLFWARSENRDFVEAEVEAGKIYFIEANPKMGALKAAVRLVAVNPTDEKKMKKILKLLAKKPSESFTQEQLIADSKELEDAVVRGIEKYKKKRGARLTSDLKEQCSTLPNDTFCGFTLVTGSALGVEVLPVTRLQEKAAQPPLTAPFMLYSSEADSSLTATAQRCR